ncbi:MAG: glycosyltransferase family 4 protein [Armatimonadetes bacterium]|nr:glycosyltransferase family 4 protein [Armatimonadota bacterium]
MQGSKRSQGPRLAIVSTYVPRRCGLATFARDLAAHYGASEGAGADDFPKVVAMSPQGANLDYPPEVVYEIRRDRPGDFRSAADFLNRSPIDIVSLQHEFGIFGGEDGDLVLRLLTALRKPVVATLHTVLRDPTGGQRETLKEICDHAAAVMVLAQAAVPILEAVYDVPSEKIVFIPHGAPDLPFSDPAFYQESLGLTGKRVIMTFGHLGPGKGIEMGLEAMARLAPDYRDVVYLVVGATHPELLQREGEAYREGLERMAADLNLNDTVQFVNRHLSDEEVEEYLQAADIFVAPYPGADQIASGPLAYAVAAGKAVVATPFVAAQELLAEGRGLLTPFNDAEALAQNLRDLLDDPVKSVKMRKAAYRHGRGFTWPSMGGAYRKLCSELAAGTRPVTVAGGPHAAQEPELRWDHLLALCDDTGVLQHAKYAIPDHSHGYCTDDNARALLVACARWRLNECPEALALIHRTLSFLSYGFNDANSRMRNFMSYDRNWSEKSGSEDSHGRTVWAAGYAAAHAPRHSGQRVAFELFHKLLDKLPKFISPRAWAFSLLGISAYLSRFEGDTAVKRVGRRLAERLADRYESAATRKWRWFEEIVSYDNGRLPEALLSASVWGGDERFRRFGLQSLEWLFEGCTADEGHMSLVGCRGFWRKGKGKARFDQQPICAAAMVAAARRAFEVTGDRVWIERATTAFGWFLGRNDTGTPLVDPLSGGCSDGLTPLGVNENMGAESTLSWMLAASDIAEIRAGDQGVVLETVAASHATVRDLAASG